MDEEGRGSLFETKEVGMGRTRSKLYAISVLAGLTTMWAYRATHIPEEGGWSRWSWIGVFAAEVWFGFYWIITQAVRWNPTSRRTFKDRLLAQRYQEKLPHVDVFVCTADPTIEPPAMVVSTVLSVIAYEYPSEKLSVYLSDDGGSELTFYALQEASRFAETWLPFCNKFEVVPRSPAAYFAEEDAKHGGVPSADWSAIKRLYKEMESRIDAAVKLGRVPDDQRGRHKGFGDWNSAATPRDHQAIVQILIDGRDPNAVDSEGFRLPTLVYMAREKRPAHHHNFKAGAMNSLLRVSSEISNGAVILNVDCDMYSSNSQTVKDALCFFMDEEKGHEFAYVQLPQSFGNITRNDIYGNSLQLISEVDFHGWDGIGGPLYIGSACFHRREALMGKKYDPHSRSQLELGKNNIEGSTSAVEEKARSLVTCSYEHNTEWGKKIGLLYGCPVEDVITGLAIQCRGWKSIFFTPERTGFLGVAPVTLAQTLIQQKRWSEGDLQIFLSKYCPLIFGHGRIGLPLQLAYSTYCLWAPCSFPTLYCVAVLPLTLLHGISLYPSMSSFWFVPFAYVIAATKTHGLWEAFCAGYTARSWWNEQRMWLYKRLASYPFAVVDTLLKLLGVNKYSFVVTAKVADGEVAKRYEREMMEFGGPPSLMFTILATTAMLNLACFVCGAARTVIGDGGIGSMEVQLAACGVLVAINIPLYEAMFLRKDAGRMPGAVTFTSIALSILALALPLQQSAR